ncbi:MAG: hypothetical protein GWN07_31535, partial [Actinobacteria bacterium]|nr:hypothetical protein [Actinomycetota bacterium]NIS35252.1 hypothetical protein [Actinomycetota bacterium]NIT98018.1 hypothetical protein [Actinomycetota bacterium]NIU69966.1 hypothetical protein [Actinomycetota bacterium]NIV58187.1 hypothetical protein [Actinomycetota bacterium]
MDRFPTAGAFGSALTDPGFRHGDVPAASRAEVKRWRRAAASATGAAAVTTLLWIGSTLGPGPAEPVDQLVFSLGTGQSLGQFRSFGLAPDGSFLVYQGPGGDGPARLWRRDWQVLEPTLVLAAEGGVSM